ncbi:MAG: hypothetical protein EPN53_01210 [Acidobacteria bacterium]|nr:MAG: hypothetical protein EPN53_01210 [Acidobacteriota bacterium]
MIRRLVVLVAVVAAVAVPAAAREMSSAYVVTAVANLQGAGGTDWHTDLTLYNPHKTVLYVKLVFLPTDQDNSGGAPTAPLVDLQPWETLNLWDVLGPSGFDVRGEKGAMLVYADTAANNCPSAAGDTTCDFAVFARNYTLDPTRASGEFGQDFPGVPSGLGVDSSVIAYMPQISDNGDFRTNVGVASWTADWVTVREDVQDVSGNIIGRYDHTIPPNGHRQWRLEVGDLTGGTVAVYIASGPSDAMVYPYATVVDNTTGDATTVEAQISTVGLSAQAASVRAVAPRSVPKALPVPTFSLDALRRRDR